MTTPTPPNADETKPPGQRYPAFDLERDFEAAWEAWKKGEKITQKNIPDLIALLEKFGERCSKESASPMLMLCECDILTCDNAGRSLELPAFVLESCTFLEAASFMQATFNGLTSFFNSTFAKKTVFLQVSFLDQVSFLRSKFDGDASFDIASFSSRVVFSEAVFASKASFAAATFSGHANFEKTTFSDSLVLRRAEFSHSPLDLRSAQFMPQTADTASRLRMDLRNLRVGTGVLSADLLLTKEQLGRITLTGEDGNTRDDLEKAALQYSALAGNFRAMAGPESYDLDDHCRNKYYELQRKLCATAPRFWQRGLGVAKWWVFKNILCYLQNPWKLLMRMAAVIIVFTVLFALPGFGIVDVDSNQPGDEATLMQTVATYFYFSGISFTTIGYGDWRPVGFSQVVAMLEGLLGITLSACFTISLTRRYIR